MEFRASRKALQEALQVAAAVAALRTSGKEVLQSIHLTADESGLLVRATDYEIAVRVKVAEAQVKSPGVILLPAGQVAALVREVAEPELEMKADGSVCQVTCGRSRFKLTVYDPSTFPELPEAPSVFVLELPQEVFQQAVSRVVFAAAEDRTRYAFDGVKVLAGGGKLELVATDGKRLAHYVTPINGTGELDALLPARALSQAAKVLGGGEEACRLAVEENRFALVAGPVELTCQQVEGRFPDYQPLLARELPHRVEVAREELQQALRRAALFAPREARSVSLRFSEGLLAVSARAAELGEAETEVSVDYAGPTTELGFNVDYLLDFLKAAQDETVSVAFVDADNASRWQSGEGFQYLVMPIVR